MIPYHSHMVHFGEPRYDNATAPPNATIAYTIILRIGFSFVVGLPLKRFGATTDFLRTQNQPVRLSGICVHDHHVRLPRLELNQPRHPLRWTCPVHIVWTGHAGELNVNVVTTHVLDRGDCTTHVSFHRLLARGKQTDEQERND